MKIDVYRDCHPEPTATEGEEGEKSAVSVQLQIPRYARDGKHLGRVALADDQRLTTND